jgi:hypothetical protein
LPLKRDRILRRRIGNNRVVTEASRRTIFHARDDQPTKRATSNDAPKNDKAGGSKPRAIENKGRRRRREKDFVTSPSKEEEEEEGPFYEEY